MNEEAVNQYIDNIRKLDEIKSIKKLFDLVFELSCSDLHLQAGTPPLVRLGGVLKRVTKEPLTEQDIENLITELLPEEKINILKSKGDLDFAFGIHDKGRLRINIFYQRGSISIACRLVNTTIPTFEELNLPPKAFEHIATMHAGLVIIAGITGSGKSTSLASIVETINKTRQCHILTIEDPLEYLHTNKNSYISQREVGIDVDSFPKALKFAMRQDPDVILVGEMRDAETISFGLSAAETGHLVLTTLHASSASQAIGRILDFFPANQQPQIRQSLQFNLRSIICQKLIPSTKDEYFRVPSVEVMFVTPTIKELIKKADDLKIFNAIKQGTEELMQDFNASLIQLVEQKLISKEIALEFSPNPDALKMNFKGIYLSEDKSIF